MAKPLVLSLLFIALTGCAGPRDVVRYEPLEVLVPVAVPCPEPPRLDRPVLPIARIDSSASPERVMRAYVASMFLLTGYASQLEELLDAYRKPSFKPSE